jgi:WD40 repeat protein
MMAHSFLACCVLLNCLGAAGESTALGKHEGPLQCVATDLAGRWIAAAGDAGEILLWDGATRKRTETLTIRRSQRGKICSLAFSPDGKLLAAGGSLPRLPVWETKSWTQVASLDVELLAGRLAFSHDSKYLMADWSTLRTSNWSRLDAIVPMRAIVSSIAIHPKSSVAAIAWSPDGKVALWD